MDYYCFACGRRRQSGRRLADTRDGQLVLVGPDCYRAIVAAGADGYRPPKGGPRLWTVNLPNCRGKSFCLSNESAPDLNYFTESDVERDYKAGSRVMADDLQSIDALQRWMRDAQTGDVRPLGKVFIICLQT